MSDSVKKYHEMIEDGEINRTLIRTKNDNKNKQMTTLLEQLKPEVAQALENNRNKYDYSITDIYNKLDTKHFYSELSIADMRDLTVYGDVDYHLWDSTDWRFGTKLFNN